MKMPKKELYARYVVFIFAVIVAGLGVALTARATLGLNSVACLAYVSSLFYPITMGMASSFINFLCLIGQYLLFSKEERKDKKFNLLLQIPALVFLGICVDFWLLVTAPFFEGTTYSYFICVLIFIVATTIVAYNINLQAVANVTMLSVDAFVIVLSRKIHKKMGNVKIAFDVFLVSLAAIISFVMTNFERIEGIREGTILGAFLVGFFVQRFTSHTKLAEKFIDKFKS